VEDWEQFFQEKSRRRFDKDRRSRRGRGIPIIIGGILIGAAIVAAIMGASFFD
jgi:hypothetical protein